MSRDTEESSQPGPRREVGDAASSRRYPPHVAGHDRDAPVQREAKGRAIPTLPANAHGSDRADLTRQPPIREGSMYEQRPGEDKDSPPSETGGR